MANIYKTWNGPMPTTAAQAGVTTGTSAVKTLLQLATPSTTGLTVVGWGISFDGAVSDKAIKCELVDTDVAATVTAHVAAGVLTVGGNGPASTSRLTLGTAATGYTATAEGTITATRVIDAENVQSTASRTFLRPLGQEWTVATSRFLRVRITPNTLTTAVNAWCWVEWTEA
jgi:hypothetical protein